MVYDDDESPRAFREIPPNRDVPPARRRVSVAAVRSRAEHAIARRLGHTTPDAVRGVKQDPDRPNAVLLHVNSGGNSLACEAELVNDRYTVEHLGPSQTGYGVVLRVGVPAA